MSHYVVLDVSLDQTSLCVLDVASRIIRETKLDTEPDAIAKYLERAALAIERIGSEAGPLSQWLHAALVAHGPPAACIETRDPEAALGAVPVKTDRSEARGIAQLMRTGWFKDVCEDAAGAGMAFAAHPAPPARQ